MYKGNKSFQNDIISVTGNTLLLCASPFMCVCVCVPVECGFGSGERQVRKDTQCIVPTS